jgi:CubicO group peptidase (beta-lactamase class C family)
MPEDTLELKKGYRPQSLEILVTVGGKTFINRHWGKEFRYYDVGSMTKIMVTTFLCMKLFEERKLKLQSPIKEYLGFLRDSKVGGILIKDCLRHFSGLTAWKPFYEKSHDVSTLKELFRKEKVKAKKLSVYSDLDFILLGWVVEEIMGMSLSEAAALYIFKPLGLDDTFFTPKKYFKSAKDFAPTEVSKTRGLVQGEVFDGNAWSMGGVGGHAGLFSTAKDVNHMGRWFLDAYNGKKSTVLKSRTLRAFIKRALPKNKGDWGLGFTLPSHPISTAGTKVSSLAFGHVGFTGTSLWVDPKRRAVVTILSNGSYPNGSNLNFKLMRRELHDQIWEKIDHASK